MQQFALPLPVLCKTCGAALASGAPPCRCDPRAAALLDRIVAARAALAVAADRDDALRASVTAVFGALHGVLDARARVLEKRIEVVGAVERDEAVALGIESREQYQALASTAAMLRAVELLDTGDPAYQQLHGPLTARLGALVAAATNADDGTGGSRMEPADARIDFDAHLADRVASAGRFATVPP